MTSLVNAQNAVVKGRVRVITLAVRPRKAHAPTGSGLRTRPAMVERKIARSCHALTVSSGGLGIANRRIRPIATEMTRGTNLAPFGGGDGGEDGDWVALRGLRARRGLEERELWRKAMEEGFGIGLGFWEEGERDDRRRGRRRRRRWWREVVERKAEEEEERGNAAVEERE